MNHTMCGSLDLGRFWRNLGEISYMLKWGGFIHWYG